MASTCPDLPRFAYSVINLTIIVDVIKFANRGKTGHIFALRNFLYDTSAFLLPRQDSSVKVLEGNYCDKLRQIGAIGLAGYYGFTTIEETKIRSVK